MRLGSLLPVLSLFLTTTLLLLVAKPSTTVLLTSPTSI